ncbi:MAG: DUF4494 domain-containing protein [Bacteroidia bacterium]|nr:DUF4494 domain-containing protein [Bacteroidia bacterium]
MKSWFICTVKYSKTDEKGNRKKITEPYLVDAVSFSEAEARIYQELGSVIKDDFQVSDINKSSFEEVFHYDDSENWYKCKVTYHVTDEDTEKEKKVIKYMLVSASNAKTAYERIEENLKDMLIPYQIPSIVESTFAEVFVYESDKDRIPDNLIPLSSLNGQ